MDFEQSPQVREFHGTWIFIDYVQPPAEGHVEDTSVNPLAHQSKSPTKECQQQQISAIAFWVVCSNFV